MATNLTRIGEKARKELKLIFTSLYHHISDEDNLRACYETLDARKAPGVDGVTKDEYGRILGTQYLITHTYDMAKLARVVLPGYPQHIKKEEA